MPQACQGQQSDGRGLNAMILEHSELTGHALQDAMPAEPTLSHVDTPLLPHKDHQPSPQKWPFR